MKVKYFFSKLREKVSEINAKQMIKDNWKTYLLAAAILICAFFAGRGIGASKSNMTTTSNNVQNSENWGLGFGEDGTPPTASKTADELKKYDAYYIGDGKEKVIYLTFDCGYENGNTKPILEALKKHNAPATFFVLGNFVTENPELIKQMVADGHNVGNHTMNHKDPGKMSKEEFEKEIKDLENAYKEVTNQEMKKFYRPPQGKYSAKNLEEAKALGYKTIFWSLAYVDWYTDKQPSKEQAFSKLVPRIHSGAVVLLHNTSKTNGEILDELLTKWEEQGYRFDTLDNLCNSQ